MFVLWLNCYKMRVAVAAQKTERGNLPAHEEE